MTNRQRRVRQKRHAHRMASTAPPSSFALMSNARSALPAAYYMRATGLDAPRCRIGRSLCRSGVVQSSVGIVFSAPNAFYSLRRITSDPGAGHFLSAMRVFDRAMSILSGTKRKTHVFWSPSWGIFGCSFFGQAILVFQDFPFNTSRGKKEKLQNSCDFCEG